MNDNGEIDRRKSLSFAQAEGAAALPEQLQPKQVSKQLRALVWDLILDSVQTRAVDAMFDRGSYVVGPWADILFDHFVYVRYEPADEFNVSWDFQKSWMKGIIWSEGYVNFFDFLQFVLRHNKRPYLFADRLGNILDMSRAAYILVDDNTFVPKQTEEEAKVFLTAIGLAEQSKLKGPKQHLLNSASACTTGRYADSIRESIHAVESVAVLLVPGTKELGPALAKLEGAKAIHGGMKAGFASLYGFTSNEQGIRHSLLDKDVAAVDEADALFMLGACAAFVSYLINKARSASLF